MPESAPLSPPAAVAPPGRILIIRPSALGDVCRSVPVLVSLKRAFPGAKIDWLVQDSFVDAIRAHPDLNEVIPFERKRWSGWYSPRVAPQFVDWLRGLRERRYDLVIDAQGLARSGFFAHATRASRRIGPSDARELGWLFYTQRVAPAPGGRGHTVDRMLDLVVAAGAKAVRDLRLYAPAAELLWVDHDERFAGSRVVTLAPTSRWPGKRWPAERFAQAAKLLLDSGRFDRVAIVGSASERGQCAALLELASQESRVVDLIGKTSVGRMMAVIARSALVIANDSAALHMAVGFDRPLVALFGPTEVAKVGPFGRERDVIQHVSRGERLDHKDEAHGRALMERIKVEEVLARAMSHA